MPASLYCPFCHQHSQFTGVTKAVPHQGINWWIGMCNNGECQRLTLIAEDGAIVYPSAQPEPTAPEIPEHIAEDLDEAKRCYVNSCYRACAIMARRCLEVTCADKGATGGNLKKKIEDMRARGAITADLAEWADTLRLIGNDAAHDLEATVDEDDATDLLELAKQFLQVVYVAPAIAAARRAARGIS